MDLPNSRKMKCRSHQAGDLDAKVNGWQELLRDWSTPVAKKTQDGFENER